MSIVTEKQENLKNIKMKVKLNGKKDACCIDLKHLGARGCPWG